VGLHVQAAAGSPETPNRGRWTGWCLNCGEHGRQWWTGTRSQRHLQPLRTADAVSATGWHRAAIEGTGAGCRGQHRTGNHDSGDELELVKKGGVLAIRMQMAPMPCRCPAGTDDYEPGSAGLFTGQERRTANRSLGEKHW